MVGLKLLHTLVNKKPFYFYIFLKNLLVTHSTVRNLLILKYQVFFPSNKIFLVNDRLDVGAGWGSIKINIS